jgi:hypothetical protein
MKPFYLVQSNYKGQSFIHEMDLDGTTREQLVDQLAQGQFETGTLEKVIMVSIETNTSLDVSQEIAAALQALSHAKRDELTENVAAFVESQGYKGYAPPPAWTGFLCAHPYREDRDAA